MDYKNSREGRIVAQKYADILPLPRPASSRPKMSLQNRAKIFSPFAALRGYEEEIADETRVNGLVAKAEMSDEDKNSLSDKLLQVKKGMRVKVRFFHADEVYTPLGCYMTAEGTVTRLDPVYRELELRGKIIGELEKNTIVRVSFDDLAELTGEGIVDIEEYLGRESYPED